MILPDVKPSKVISKSLALVLRSAPTPCEIHSWNERNTYITIVLKTLFAIYRVLLGVKLASVEAKLVLVCTGDGVCVAGTGKKGRRATTDPLSTNDLPRTTIPDQSKFTQSHHTNLDSHILTIVVSPRLAMIR